MEKSQKDVDLLEKVEENEADGPQAPSPQQGPRGIGGVMDEEKMYSLEETRTRVDILAGKQEMLRRAIETGTNAMAACQKVGIKADEGIPSLVMAAVNALTESLEELKELKL